MPPTRVIVTTAAIAAVVYLLMPVVTAPVRMMFAKKGS